MKTLKSILMVFLFALFAVGISNAQNKNKATENDSWDYEGYIPCTNDYVTGVETMVLTHWQSKYQALYKGEYVSTSTGKHYSWSLVVNINWKEFIPGMAGNYTKTSTSVIECEGEPVALYKIRVHVSVNANGELVVYRDWNSGDGWICL